MTTKPPSKKVAATRGAQDAVVELFVAEDVRIEEGGKVTVVGMYADRVIVALLPPDAPTPSKEAPIALELAFLVNIRKLVGEHEVSLEIGGSESKPSARTVSFSNTGSSANLVGRARPLLIASFGVKTVTITIDGVAFHRTFEVRRGVAPVVPSVPSPALVAPRKTASAEPPRRRLNLKGSRSKATP